MTAILSFLLHSGLAFAVGSTLINPSVEYREFDYNGVDKLIISNSSGRIAISPMPLQKIEITINKRKFGERCGLSVRKEEATMVIIKVDKPLGEVCEVDFDVRVPKELNAELTSGSGSITVDGLEAGLKFDIGSGNLKASGKWKKIDGKTGSGGVEITGISGPVALKVGSGQVNLGFTENARGDVSVTTGTGDAQLMFPNGTKLKTALITANGSVDNQVGESPRPELNVSVTAGSGDLSVKAY